MESFLFSVGAEDQWSVLWFIWSISLVCPTQMHTALSINLLLFFVILSLSFFIYLFYLIKLVLFVPHRCTLRSPHCSPLNIQKKLRRNQTRPPKHIYQVFQGCLGWDCRKVWDRCRTAKQMKRMRCMEKHSWASGFRGEGGRDWISLGLRRVEGRAAGEAAGGLCIKIGACRELGQSQREWQQSNIHWDYCGLIFIFLSDPSPIIGNACQ